MSVSFICPHESLCLYVARAAWAQAVAALMILGLLILIGAFILSCVALCCTLNVTLLPVIGVMLLVVGKKRAATLLKEATKNIKD